MGGLQSITDRAGGFGGHLRVRQAGDADYDILQRWAGEGGSPSIAITGGMFASESRRETFEKAIGEKALHFLILEKYESGGWVALGALISNRNGEIHLVLDSSFRGRGLSVPAIRATLEYLHEYPLFELTACIGRGDEVSRRAFEKAGFTCRGEKTVGGTTCLEYVRQMKPRCPAYNVFI
ncbi:MAG TPA: GNAT family N-acetyltransferase [Syntrophales bacterium]|nr:GNAT family N-acetyltransferase [Syntrophales bacterium]HRT62493.1 GNAT family N-acetyltransferase [Syntrophales bacterium]